LTRQINTHDTTSKPIKRVETDIIIINYALAPYNQKWLTDMTLNENALFLQ